MTVLLSTDEVATSLGIHHFSVCRLIRQGALRAKKIGRSWVVLEDDLKQLAKTYH
jgi:excisionase family DNA binding protein